MIELLLFMLAGCLLGVFTGIVPGIHVNLVSLWLIGLAPAVGPHLAATAIISMAITHTFFDVYPSILLGAPEAGTALLVLPGHKMLMEGKGAEAIYLTVVGGALAVFACLLMFPVFLIALPVLYQNAQGAIPYILAVIAGVMIITEHGWKGRAAGLSVFLLAGALGLIVLDSNINIALHGHGLFPMFTGLFGVSTLIMCLERREKVPEQRLVVPDVPRKLAISGVLKGLFSGALVGTFPGVGASQATVLAQQITKRESEREFLISMGAINTIVALFSLISLYTISKARSGAALAVQEILPSFGAGELALLVGAALIAVGFSVIVMLKVTKHAVRLMQRLDSPKFTLLIVGLLVVLVFIFTGWWGVFILFISASIGLLAPCFGVKRSNLMGCLMVPLIIFYLSFI